ncbi:NADH-quinone oxidoreductase subunit A [Dissulfurirhabdus thermomarina]|uniref:NADH-quinone oxidoreductase subunit n=1 Tax=Dissulfurirhabdus thermomarina TaxID=1765737 RepID=A0A6N9TPV7_DISTH|nr:NADH-quinone oxidoreductase subunit A [Dissulfurirhabdus thermomarina]NDY41477.1 NADH-quinone oxidoreductase subunit A [Dissulfurirhabdus thermomarina]NMX24241.1 NADH-quinone oxidoreductase subunit A [Dissulfurirhabdus thermomarina]
MSGFETIAMYLVVSVAAILGMLIISALLGPMRPKPGKLDTYECGVPLLDAGHKRYDVKYYVVAVLFLVFDLETVLIYPLAVRYKALAQFGWGVFFEIFVFVAVLLAGLIYAIRKGAIEWD